MLPHKRLEDILQVMPLMSILSPHHLDARPKVVPQYLCNALSLAVALALPPFSRTLSKYPMVPLSKQRYPPAGLSVSDIYGM